MARREVPWQQLEVRVILLFLLCARSVKEQGTKEQYAEDEVAWCFVACGPFFKAWAHRSGLRSCVPSTSSSS